MTKKKQYTVAELEEMLEEAKLRELKPPAVKFSIGKRVTQIDEWNEDRPAFIIDIDMGGLNFDKSDNHALLFTMPKDQYECYSITICKKAGPYAYKIVSEDAFVNIA